MKKKIYIFISEPMNKCKSTPSLSMFLWIQSKIQQTNKQTNHKDLANMALNLKIFYSHKGRWPGIKETNSDKKTGVN